MSECNYQNKGWGRNVTCKMQYNVSIGGVLMILDSLK